ncbi:MAG TPA: hypothetical protein VGZ03_11010, partial [Acidimicrobiales bacterium]|nr:hypothetical protein [Acidimicrobiales bacterium]
MRRAPWVIAGTAAGIAGLLTFHTTPVKVALAPLPTTIPPAAGGATTTTQPATSTRSAAGASVNYYYGTMSVSVTVSGSHLTRVTIGSLNDGGNSLSQSIDQTAIPQLEQQAIAAQSANIQGVS